MIDNRDCKRPYVRFFASDWLAGTRGMRAAEIGVYITLIALMYERCEPLPENHRRLARQCGCDTSGFKKALQSLVEERKIIRVEGGIWNERVQREFDFRGRKSQDAKEAANARWRKNNGNNSPEMRTHTERSATGIPYQKPEPNITPNGVIGADAPKQSPRGELLTTLDAEHAQAVVEHRQKIKKPLTVHAAKLLAGKFRRCPDPNAAADTMIANGWQGFEPEWLEQRVRGAALERGRGSNGIGVYVRHGSREWEAWRTKYKREDSPRQWEFVDKPGLEVQVPSLWPRGAT